MKSVKPRQIIKILEKQGFKFVRQKGSHGLYRQENLRVTIPYHSKDIKPGTLRNILKQSELSKEDLESN